MKGKIKYFNKDMPKLKQLPKGDWIDLRVNDLMISDNSKEHIQDMVSDFRPFFWNTGEMFYIKGDIIFMKLGIAMELPKGYEVEIRPRSSTFINTGLILTNSVGTIDNSYCGNDDEWCAMFYATRDGSIKQWDRILQFRVNTNMPKLELEEVPRLSNVNRSGFGSTGIK